VHFQNKFFSKNKFEFFWRGFFPTVSRASMMVSSNRVVIDQSLKDHFALIERPLSENKYCDGTKQDTKNGTGASP
jgi:hypothetical protein